MAVFSAALSRRIRALAVAKMGGQVWLPGAYGLWQVGMALLRGETVATHPGLVVALGRT